MAEHLADYGFVTFLAGYRLFNPRSGANPWPAQLDDAQRAIRWVRAHADEFNVDLDVSALGYSGPVAEITAERPLMRGDTVRIERLHALGMTWGRPL